MSQLDLTLDQLLTTTRSVRKRLDFSRPVEPELVRECLEIALQAPTGSNQQNWHFLVVDDAQKKQALADLYRQSYKSYRHVQMSQAKEARKQSEKRQNTQEKIFLSSDHLAEHLQDAPFFVIPCFYGRIEALDTSLQASVWGSILPATWNFMLAARARGLGSAWTTLHLVYEKNAAAILGIPYEKVTQAALLPVAYTLGTDFKPANREPLDTVLHWNQW